jgi:hypothetical protein
MQNAEWYPGHKSLISTINVKKELQRFKRDPMDPFLNALGQSIEYVVLENEFSLYRETYQFYYLCLDRFLNEMSIAVRWRNGPYWVRKEGGKYTPSQRALAQKYNQIARFLELDFFNCLLYARMLLDRTIVLSRYFLKGKNLPSFTSFNDHKKFFQRQSDAYGKHEEYASYIRNNTDWFDIQLKLVRDKFLVHSGLKHMRVFGYLDHEFGLAIVIPGTPDADKTLAQLRSVIVSISQLSHDIEQFLTWFSQYGIKAISSA